MTVHHNATRTAQRAARPWIAFSVLLGTLDALNSVLIAALLAHVIDAVFLQRAGLASVQMPLLWLVIAAFTRGALAMLRELSAAQAAITCKRTLRAALVAHLFHLGPAYTQYQQTGELAAVVLAGVERMDPWIARYKPQTMLCVTVPLTILVAVFLRDRVSAVILLATAPVLPLLLALVGSYAQTHIDRQWAALTQINAYFLEALQGLPTLAFFGRGEAEGRRMAAVGAAFSRRTLGVLRYAFLSALVLEFITAGAIALIAVELGTRLLDGGISFERALFILLLAPEYFRPLRDLGTHRHAAMEAMPALESIERVLDTPVTETPPTVAGEGLPMLRAAAPSIVLRQLSFSYPGMDQPAIAGIDLELPAGSCTALVGPSGSGKSTLVHLLLRFIEPSAGQLLVDGAPLQSMALERWRDCVALVPQRPYLFAGTIYENISFGRPGATRQEVEHAAVLAGAAEFIEQLPDGFRTQTGERGARLSGGEGQRIAIARAFLKDAPIVILDEPTSSLDPTTEALIREALERLRRDRTVLIVAHRLNTVVTADQIAVLDHGRLVELGRHGDLLRRHGSYSDLVGTSAQARR